MKKNGNKNRFMASTGIFLLLAAGVGELAARNLPVFASWYSQNVYPGLVSVIARFWNLFPVSCAEFLIYGLALLYLWLLYRLLRNFNKPAAWKRFGASFLLMAGYLAAGYVFLCGINYYRPPFSSYQNLEIKKRSKAELEDLCRYLTKQVNIHAHPLTYQEEWRAEGQRTMTKLGEQYPALAGYYPKPKPLTVSWILSVQQLCGIYAPYTVEGNYNRVMPRYNVPHTMCHELSHLRSFMREDEANFIGYLGCITSENADFIYSGYLTGWVYAGNELAKQNPVLYRELYESLCPQADADLEQNNAFWNRYEGKPAEVSNKMNDTYLKINSQEEGVKTYGRMVDLMLAYYDGKY